MTNIKTPNSYDEAIKSINKERWIEAMTKEIADLEKHHTWEWVPKSSVPRTHRITKSYTLCIKP